MPHVARQPARLHQFAQRLVHDLAVQALIPFDEQVLRAVFGKAQARGLVVEVGRGKVNEAEEIVLPEFILLKPEPKGKSLEEKRLERE